MVGRKFHRPGLIFGFALDGVYIPPDVYTYCRIRKRVDLFSSGPFSYLFGFPV